LYKPAWGNAIRILLSPSGARVGCCGLGCPALVDVTGDFWRFWNVEVFQFLDFEAGVSDQVGDVAVQVAAAGQLFPAGGDAVLPLAGAIVGGFAVFEEQEFSARFEYPPHLLERCLPVGDGAQGEGQQYGIDGVVLQGDLLPRQVQPLYLDGRLCKIRLGFAAHAF
jgi:hypothetical protein